MGANKFFITFVLVLGFLMCSESVISQVTEIAVIDSTSQKQKKWKFGVGFGLNFVGGTNVSLAPNVTYIVSEKISFGVGIQGSYAAIKDLQSTTTFGGNAIALYTPFTKLTTLVEFAQLKVNTETETTTGTLKTDYWDSALFIGAGFNITDKISVGAKYNVLYDDDESVYTSAIIPFVNITF